MRRALHLGAIAALCVAPLGCSLLDWSALRAGGPESADAGGEARDAGASDRAEAAPEAATADAGRRCDPSAPFGPPVVLPGPINDLNDNEVDGFLTPDELTLYFARDQGDGAKFDIFVATRSDPGAAFGAPTPVPGLSTTSAAETAPFLSRDRTTMFFALDTGDGRPHVYSAKANGGGFGTPELLTALTSTSPAQSDPFFAGSSLYFTDAYDDRAMIAGVQGASFTAAVAIPGLPTTATAPKVTDDELTVFFQAPGGAGRGADVFVAHRTSVKEPFGTAQRVEELSTTGVDAVTWVSGDGCHVLVSQVANSVDLYFAARGL